MTGAALVAVLAASVVAVSSASAAPVWLNMKGEEVTTATAATTEGTIIIHHTGGLGEAEFECKGTFVGTVGAGAADKVNEVFNSSKEKDLYLCKQLKGICSGAEDTVHADNLPWTTALVEEGGAIWDKFTAANSGPGWIVLCGTFFGNVEILCALSGEKTKFIQNGGAGAEFKYEGATSGEVSCSDGGKGYITSPSNSVTKEFLVGIGEVARFEGPSWWVAKARLGSGNNKKLSVVATGAAGIVLKGSSVEVTCNAASIAKGLAEGSAANAPGTDSGELSLTGCKATQAGCEVSSLRNKGTEKTAVGTIGPYTLPSELAFPEKNNTVALDVISENSTEKLMFDVSLEKCEVAALNKVWEVTGSVTAKMIKTTGAALAAKEEVTTLRLDFEGAGETNFERWNGTKYVLGKARLLMGGTVATLKGTIDLELNPQEAFGWTNS